MFRNILKRLFILQEVSNYGPIKKGKGYTTARRFNPYNPLSYAALIVILVVGILMFGFVGFWKETDTTNPFKWN